jgi:hypothetical protein
MSTGAKPTAGLTPQQIKRRRQKEKKKEKSAAANAFLADVADGFVPASVSRGGPSDAGPGAEVEVEAEVVVTPTPGPTGADPEPKPTATVVAEPVVPTGGPATVAEVAPDESALVVRRDRALATLKAGAMTYKGASKAEIMKAGKDYQDIKTKTPERPASTYTALIESLERCAAEVVAYGRVKPRLEAISGRIESVAGPADAGKLGEVRAELGRVQALPATEAVTQLARLEKQVYALEAATARAALAAQEGAVARLGSEFEAARTARGKLKAINLPVTESSLSWAEKPENAKKPNAKSILDQKPAYDRLTKAMTAASSSKEAAERAVASKREKVAEVERAETTRLDTVYPSRPAYLAEAAAMKKQLTKLGKTVASTGEPDPGLSARLTAIDGPATDDHLYDESLPKLAALKADILKEETRLTSLADTVSTRLNTAITDVQAAEAGSGLVRNPDTKVPDPAHQRLLESARDLLAAAQELQGAPRFSAALAKLDELDAVVEEERTSRAKFKTGQNTSYERALTYNRDSLNRVRTSLTGPTIQTKYAQMAGVDDGLKARFDDFKRRIDATLHDGWLEQLSDLETEARNFLEKEVKPWTRPASPEEIDAANQRALTRINDELRGLLASETCFRGRKDGGRLTTRVPAPFWRDIYDRHHNVPIGRKLIRDLKENEQIRSYVTRTSNSVNGFDVSYHIWEDGADTLVTVLVLHLLYP